MSDCQDKYIPRFPSPYPNTLFHFTDQLGLLGIIIDRAFNISYTTEAIGYGEDNLLGIPMVSFCDLRMSDLPYHMTRYGEYGIGLHKDWAIEKGLNPVGYINKNCDLVKVQAKGIQHFNDYVEGLYTEIENNDEVAKSIQSGLFNKMHEINNALNNNFSYMKNYQGVLIRKRKIVDRNYRFADEREWRYVLPVDEDRVLHQLPNTIVSRDDYNKSEWNSMINSKLYFEFEAIKYIIVPDNSEASKLRDYIANMENVNTQSKNYLLSLILTAVQIREDM